MTWFVLAMIHYSQLAHGKELFTHRLENVPRGAATCDQVVGPIREKFERSTGVEVYSATVESETADGCEIQIAYLAESKLSVVSTVDEGSASSEPYQAAYWTLANCEQNLEREKRLLESQTKSLAWIAYCYREASGFGSARRLQYVPFAQSFASSSVRLYKASSTVWVRPNDSWKVFAAGIIGEAEKTQLVKLASVSFNPGMMQSDRELVLRFYDIDRRWLRIEGHAEHDDPQACAAQVEKLRAQLRRAQQPPLWVFCGNRFPQKYQVGIVHLSDNILGGPGIRAYEDPKHFASRAQCEDALPAVVGFHQTTLKNPVLAGFCGGKKPYRITLFEDAIKGRNGE